MKRVMFLHAGAELYGADNIMLELIRGLDKKKYEVDVLLPNSGPLVEKLQKENVNVEVLGYPILRRKYFTPWGIVKYIFNYYTYSRKIVTYCKQKKIDIVHVNTSAVLEGCYIKKKTKLPVVWHIHEILEKPKFIIDFMFKEIAKWSDKVVCVSEAVKKNFVKITNIVDDKICVIYNGVDNEKFHANNETAYLKKEFGIDGGELVVGMIGRVNAWKGQNDFVNAMNLVFQKTDKKVKAVLVGGVFEGQEWRMEELKNLIHKSKFKDHFIVSDFREDSPNLFCLFDVFVLPSIRPDPLPTVVLEAMASGLPVVGYAHGGVCEMVKNGENGLLADVGDVNDLSKKIIELIENNQLRLRFGKEGIKRQQKYFSVRNFVRRFEGIYEEVSR